MLEPEEAKTEFLAFSLASKNADSKLILFPLFILMSMALAEQIESLLTDLTWQSFSAGDTELVLCRVSPPLALF